MADDAPTPPRAPVFRCAECEAVWRTETQRDLCCKGEQVETTADPTDLVDRLWQLQSGAAWVCNETANTLEDAANEITRLRTALRLSVEAHKTG